MDDRIHFPSSEHCGGGKRKRKLAITGAIYIEDYPQPNRNPSLLRLEHFEHQIHKVEQNRPVHGELQKLRPLQQRGSERAACDESIGWQRGEERREQRAAFGSDELLELRIFFGSDFQTLLPVDFGWNGVQHRVDLRECGAQHRRGFRERKRRRRRRCNAGFDKRNKCNRFFLVIRAFHRRNGANELGENLLDGVGKAHELVGFDDVRIVKRNAKIMLH